MCVLNHMVRPVEACRVEVAWAVLRVGRFSHPQLYAGQDAYLLGGGLQGEQGKATCWALLASLEAGWYMPAACSLAEKEHLGKPGTRNCVFPPRGNTRSLLFGVCLVWAGSSYTN